MFTKEDAHKRPLVTAYNEKCFRVFNGPELSNLPDLLRAFQSMTKMQFSHHVKSYKNDFALWVEGVLCDSECAGNLRQAKTPRAAVAVVKKRLKDYQLSTNLSKTSLKLTLLIFVIMGFALSTAFLFYFISKNSTIQAGSIQLATATTALYEQEMKSPLPVRLKIPAIDVDAAVEYVGLTSDKAMDVPKDPADVAWFNLGARPGENGSAIMAGHYGGKKASVFDNLYKLRKGDKVSIEDDKGAIRDNLRILNTEY